jgi:hypothetical protein
MTTRSDSLPLLLAPSGGFPWRRLAFSFVLTLLAVALFAYAFAVGYVRLHEDRVLPGVEVSSTHAGTDLHILGYLFDPAHRALHAHMMVARPERLLLVTLAGLGQRPLGVEVRPGLEGGVTGVDALQARQHQRFAGEAAVADGRGGLPGGEEVRGVCGCGVCVHGLRTL